MAEFTFTDLQGLCESYEQDGYAIVRGVFDTGFIKELDQHIDWLRERHPDLRPEELGHWLIAKDPFWVRFLSDDRLLDIAQVLIGPDIASFAADYIAKPPKIGLPLHWHQDGIYWPLEPMEVVTIWFAVSESNKANGCLRIIPGTHKKGPHPHLTDEEDGNPLGTSVDPSYVHEADAIDIELEPGDVSLHHPYIIHGSNANKSDRWRRGGSIQYMPPTTRVTEENWPSTFFFRGNPVPEINQYLERPKFIEGEHMPFNGCEQWK